LHAPVLRGQPRGGSRSRPQGNSCRFGVWGLGFRVWGLGFGVWGLGFGVWGCAREGEDAAATRGNWYRLQGRIGVWGLGFGVWGLGFGVLDAPRLKQGT